MGLLFIWMVCVEGVLVLDSKAAMAGTSLTRDVVPQEELNKQSRAGSARRVGVSPRCGVNPPCSLRCKAKQCALSCG